MLSTICRALLLAVSLYLWVVIPIIALIFNAIWLKSIYGRAITSTYVIWLQSFCTIDAFLDDAALRAEGAVPYYLSLTSPLIVFFLTIFLIHRLRPRLTSLKESVGYILIALALFLNTAVQQEFQVSACLAACSGILLTRSPCGLKLLVAKT